MIRDLFVINSFEPIFLTVEGIGPFQEEAVEFDLTDSDSEPCNFFLFVSENGRGKTTLFELMVCLMELLSGGQREQFGQEELDRGSGRAQLDFLVRLHREGRDQVLVLSLCGGYSDPWDLKPWTEAELERHGAETWSYYGYRRRESGRLEQVGIRDPIVEDLLGFLKVERDAPPVGFESDPLTAPTLLYFPSSRDIIPVLNERSISQPSGWGYRVVHRFEREGMHWLSSLDNLLVWLKWLDDGRFETALEIINDRVFRGKNKYLKGIRKQPPEAVVDNAGHEHRLDRLSSGEKNLVQLFLRIGSHMTRNTIVVLDEMDLHLHSKLQHRVLNLLKGLVSDQQGLTVIASTHSREILRAFAFEVPETGLRKGGHIIEEGLGLE
jgi:energy-coupling factor transporter ATP-binding protein EcfA2